MNKSIKTKDLYDCQTPYLIPLFKSAEYPWEILPKIKEYIRTLIDGGLSDFTEISEGVFVGKNVTISPTAVIEPPVILGAGTQVRPGAYLRGNVITGEDCVLGNSSEFKNCVLLKHVQAPHYNYVGDPVLGNFSHLGAASICSNLKSDGKPVVIRGDAEYPTGLRKVGAFLADGADVGCACVLNPGTVLGNRTSVYPNNALRGVFPSDCIVKSNDNVVVRRPDGTTE